MEFEIAVIGAGIAGASAAAELATTHRVILIEAEAQPGFHSTGRSAAIFSEIYGNSLIRSLSRASRQTFEEPDHSLAGGPFIRQRGALFMARADQCDALQAMAVATDIGEHLRPLSSKEALGLCPLIRPGYTAAALLERGASDIDVDGLHQAYLRLFRARGGEILTSSRVERIDKRADGWAIEAGDARLACGIVVNAAGAWADHIARLAGIDEIGLQPCRRTAVLVDPPAAVAIDQWPMVIDIDEQFYFKPDAGLILLSPADESPIEPCDVQPDEWDVAVAIDRVMTATTLDIRRVKHKWAGLRSFVRDRTPVAGFDRNHPGFFWLAGQGGYGVQTAPALARVAAALVRDEDLPEDIAREGVDASRLAPGRF